MTVKDLKKALRGWPGDMHVVTTASEMLTRFQKADIDFVINDKTGCLNIVTGCKCEVADYRDILKRQQSKDATGEQQEARAEVQE